MASTEIPDTVMWITTDVNVSNTTEPLLSEFDRVWSAVYNAVLISITVVVMFSMGTSIQLSHLKIIFRRPVGPIIGAVCQMLLMPACCCGFALLLGLPDNIAIGMVLVGSTPGGAISNIVTFWTRADVMLSVCMTTMSTTLAVGFLPLNMFIYSRFWLDGNAVIPYVNMVITVIYVWVAAVLGYIVGWKWPKTIPYFTKIGSLLALVLIVLAAIVQGRVYTEVFEHTWRTYFASITMPLIGFVIGFVLSWIFCLGHKQRLAIGFETGIQNTTLAMTVVAITYRTLREASYYSQYIILYASFQTVFGVATILGVWIFNYIRYRETPCTTNHQFALNEQEDDEEVSYWNSSHRKPIATDDSEDKVSGIRVVSVVPT